MLFLFLVHLFQLKQITRFSTSKEYANICQCINNILAYQLSSGIKLDVVMCLKLTMFKHVREKNVGQNLIVDILMISWRLDYPWGLPARSKNPRILIKYYQLLTNWANFGLQLNLINYSVGLQRNM